MERSAYFDNARAILIFLVVFGHMLSGFIKENHIVASIYMFIFLFHMPAFILISGHFAKKIYEQGYIQKLIWKLLLPYVIFQILYSMYYYYLFDDQIEFTMLVPRWALWFLISLFLWNVLLYFFGKMKYGMFIAIVLALIVGYDYDIGEILSLSRTFFFFPFFLLGYHLNRQHFEKLKSKINVFVGFILAIVVFMIVYYYLPIDYHEWLIGKHSYFDVSKLSIELAWTERLATYAVTGLATFIFFTLVPKEKMFFTSIGKVTFSIYLMHMAFIRLFMSTELSDYVLKTHNYWLLFVISLIIIYVLSRKQIVEFTNRLMLQNYFKRRVQFMKNGKSQVMIRRLKHDS